MKKHYRKYKRPARNFEIGFRCAILDDRAWLRAEVLCVDAYPTCKVSFVDTGYQRTVERRQIYPLEPTFDKNKRLVLKCSLFGVYPTSGGRWNDKTVN